MPSRTTRWALGLWILIAGGVIWTLFLQSFVRPEVYFSGDGGLKAQMVEQFASGRWSVDLDLDSEPWVRDLWDGGFYPFGPPFVWEQNGRRAVAFPLPFIATSTPLYRSLGYRGLYLLPLLATWVVWIRFLYAGRRMGLSVTALGSGLFALIFASHLTLYSAVFWEHSLAVALAFCGLAEVLVVERTSRPGLRLAIGGLLLGLAVWLRPECAALVAGTLAVWPLLQRAQRLRRWIVLATAATIALLGFALFNHALYGTPLGLHAKDVVADATFGARAREALVLLWELAFQLARFAPATAVAVLAVFLPPQWRRRPPVRDAIPLLLAVAIFLAVTALIVPNVGGKQWGPRYLLPAVPILCLVMALLVDAVCERLPRGVWIGSLLVLTGVLAYGADLNVRIGSRELARDYSRRILPVLEVVRRSETKLIVVSHQWQAQELQGAFASHRFFRVRDAADVDRLTGELFRRDRSEFLWLEFPSGEEPRSGDVRMPSGLVVHKQLLGVYGAYVVFHCTVY